MRKLVVVASLIFFLVPGIALANSDIYGLSYASGIGLPSSHNVDMKDSLVALLRYALSFLGLFAVAMIMMAGIKWMVSAGNAERVTEAKGMLVSSLFGLVIILASFSIIVKVINSWENIATGAWASSGNERQYYGPWD